ncbi:hypothetical protein [Streptomyces nanshensis]|uniref:Uncharacterized protein n=1 Tax=Streptomyces nanshensis TaxID=518642 RepID=A0A1E7LCA2_9ACTN|nr:hypothetical protein [Streptomyces nanshensis]OEV13794.1 hypothetical protein AN218_01805 [Streptomyces nanshensis]
MSLEHSFLAIYGIELADAHWLDVSDALEALPRARGKETDSPDSGEDVQLYTVSGDDSERVVIGIACEELPPGACRALTDFTVSPGRDESLRRTAAHLGYRALAEPGWLLVHDWS